MSNLWFDIRKAQEIRDNVGGNGKGKFLQLVFATAAAAAAAAFLFLAIMINGRLYPRAKLHHGGRRAQFAIRVQPSLRRGRQFGQFIQFRRVSVQDNTDKTDRHASDLIQGRLACHVAER